MFKYSTALNSVRRRREDRGKWEGKEEVAS